MNTIRAVNEARPANMNKHPESKILCGLNEKSDSHKKNLLSTKGYGAILVEDMKGCPYSPQ
ncbi:hypothetical protein BpHYR1_049036 [Brachionus plicatilis]|uniref:Uncharacterized protein n=1 Tax=Brachionus plicatilis TaxID=10195 RepID=A0A3M7S5V6_BRAPC|nr:hypothetical protein BpHYR1_049036 [Brachionus plicatilis]